MAKVCITFFRALRFDANGNQMAVSDGPAIAAPTWLDTAGTKISGEIPEGATIARIATDGKIVRNIGPEVSAAVAGTDELMHANTTEYVGVKEGHLIAIETQA